MIRALAAALALVLGAASMAPAQAPERPRLPTRPPFVLGEHADGGEVPALMATGFFTGAVIFDVVAAPASARWHNQRNPTAPRRSPATAGLLSLGATAVPLAVGVAAFEEDSFLAFWTGVGGLVLGPSAGHFYAGRPGRALGGIGLRAGLGAAAFMIYACCT